MLPKTATYDKPQVALYRMSWDASFDLPLACRVGKGCDLAGRTSAAGNMLVLKRLAAISHQFFADGW